MHAEPRSTSSLVTVFRATPVIQEVERMLFPSTRAETTRIRSSVLSLFILSIMLEQEKVSSILFIFLWILHVSVLSFTQRRGAE